MLPAGCIWHALGSVACLKSADKWYGVTYKDDNPVGMEAIRKMEEEGLNPA